MEFRIYAVSLSSFILHPSSFPKGDRLKPELQHAAGVAPLEFRIYAVPNTGNLVNLFITS